MAQVLSSNYIKYVDGEAPKNYRVEFEQDDEINHNNEKILTQYDIDPALSKIQMEWADLLQQDDIEIIKPLKCGNLNSKQLSIVAASWFNDGVLGWRIDYPQNEMEMNCYILTRSRRFLQFYTCVFFVHMLTPFFGQPICPWKEFKNEVRVDLFTTDNGRFLSEFTINFIAIIGTTIYCIEIFLRLYVNNGLSDKKWNVNPLPWYKDKWILMRLVACIVLVIDILVYLIFRNPIRFGRSLLPLIYVTRRNSLRQMLQGLWTAFLNSFRILSFFIILLLLWSFGGFVLFRGVDASNYSSIYEDMFVNITESEEERLNRFDTPGEAFLTTLYSIISRPFNVLVLNPYFSVTPASTVFFISLTILADLLIINLIIAGGNFQYRLFGADLFRRQLVHRRQAFVSIHSIICDQRGNISRTSWIKFCLNLKGKYKTKRKNADALFYLECESDPSKPNHDTVDCVGFFRLAALLSNQININFEKIHETEQHASLRLAKSKPDIPATQQPVFSIRLSATSSRRHSTAGGGLSQYVMGPLLEGEDEDCDDSILTRNMEVHAEGSGGNMNSRVLSGDEEDRDPFSRNFRSNSIFSAGQRFSQMILASTQEGGEDDSDSDQEADDGLDSKLLSELENINRDSQTQSWKSLFLFVKYQCARLIQWNVIISTPAVPFIWPHAEMFLIEPFHLFYMLMEVLLVSQCLQISSSNRDRDGIRGWVVAGWCVMVALWMEMAVKVLVWGLRLYFRRTGLGFLPALNIATTVLMIKMGFNYEFDSAEYILYMVFQSVRLVLLLQYVTDSNAFLSLINIMYRVLFIMFCIFYAMANFGYQRLCNVFNEENVEGNQVDDSDSWINFQNMFNFDSLLQTMYTCFYVTALGNWTWIMNAAAQTERWPSLIFFTLLRLSFFVIIYPILFSFIINAFINRRNEDEKKKGLESDEHISLTETIFDTPLNHTKSNTFKYKRYQEQIIAKDENERSAREALLRAASAVTRKREGFDSRGSSRTSSFQVQTGSESSISRPTSTVDSDGSYRPGDFSLKRVKHVAKLWMSEDKLTMEEMLDLYSSGSLMNEYDTTNDHESEDSQTRPLIKSTRLSKSMMSHWSSGVKELSIEEKAKKKEFILQKLLEFTLQTIALERENVKKMREALDTAETI